MAQKYTYSVENDFPNQVVSINKFFAEIVESSIIIECLYVVVNGDMCDIWFVSTLSGPEITTLNGLVVAHDGVYTPPENVSISVGDLPTDGEKVWLKKTSSAVYYKDVNRNNKWLSINKHAFEYARKGSAKGMYLPLLGDLDDVDDTYMSGRSATIVSIFCKSKSGNKNAEFEIRKNGAMLYEFVYDGSNNMRYINDSLNFDVLLYDEIQVYVKRSGSAINNTYCKIEIAWRADG